MYSERFLLDENNCDCAICKHQHDIDIPLELVDQILSENVTLFTGAGISTESRNVLNTTFYESILDKTNQNDDHLDFPSLMEVFCHQ